MDIFRKLGRKAQKAKEAAAGASDESDAAAGGLDAAYRCRECGEEYSAPREECLECGAAGVEPVDE